jgi:hypothetical protein
VAEGRILLGARPQTPRVGFAEIWVKETFCEAELMLLLLFWKRRKRLNVEFCWGHAPRPPGSASPRFGHEAELTLLVEKKTVWDRCRKRYGLDSGFGKMSFGWERVGKSWV